MVDENVEAVGETVESGRQALHTPSAVVLGIEGALKAPNSNIDNSCQCEEPDSDCDSMPSLASTSSSDDDE